MNEKLKPTKRIEPCFWCGSVDTDNGFSLSGVPAKGDLKHGAGCMDCGAVGPESETIEEAGEKWDAMCTKLNRLAALEKVCGEIVERAPRFASVVDNNDVQTHYLIAQKLKAVLEEK